MYHCPLKAFLNIHRKKLHQRILFDRSHTTQKIVYNFNFPLLMISAHFLWRLENPKPFSERRFFKRYLTFWNLYNLFADFFFLVGLLLKLLELLMVEEVINTRKSLDNHLFFIIFSRHKLPSISERYHFSMCLFCLLQAYSTIQMADERAFHLAAGKRILWGAAFSLAILKTIKVIWLHFMANKS